MMKFINEQAMKNEIGIYKISNIVSGRVYVGQTKERFQRRYWLHQWEMVKIQQVRVYQLHLEIKFTMVLL